MATLNGRGNVTFSTIGVLTLLACWLSFHASAHAQSDDITYELDNQRVEIEALRTIEAIRNLTPDLFALTCPGVVYEDILADPDNTALNICYARLMIEQKQFGVAQSTLERLLLINPDFIEARYVYALLLFRMGNTFGADRTLALLQEQPLTDEDARRVAALRDDIARADRRLHHTVTLSLGVHYDTNRNAAPADNTLLAFGTPFPITRSEDLAQEDIGFLGIVDYGFIYDPAWDGGHSIIGSAIGYMDDQVKVDTSDLNSLILEGGLSLNALGGVLTPLATYSNVRLDGEHILSSSGASLRYDRLLQDTWLGDEPVGLSLQAIWADESYHNNNDSTVLTEQDGRRIRLEGGVVFPIADDHLLRLSLGFVDKDADASYRAYQGVTVGADHTWFLGGSQFLLSSLSFARNDYNAADPLVTGTPGTPGTVRRDDILRGRVTYGLNLGSLFGLDARSGGIDEVIAGISWTISAEYQRQDSNVANYDYKNTRLQTMLSRTWSF